MVKFLNLNPEIFGVDINDLSLRIVKLRKKRNGFSLVSYNDVPIESGLVSEGVIYDQKKLARLIASACQTVKGKKLDTRYAVVALPEEKSFSQVIQMPLMSERELSSAVPFEAENYIPIPIDKAYLDFQIIEQHADHPNHLDLLINAMPRTIVDSYVACCKEAGLIPCIMEVESQAIARALMKTSQSSPTIFIDFGQTKTIFMIFSDQSIRFTSSIAISSQQLTEAIAKEYSLPFDKAEELKVRQGLLVASDKKKDIRSAMNPILAEVVSQIKKYISFYHGHTNHEYGGADGKIEKVILSGGGSNLKGLPEFLSQELSIPVEIGDPLVNVQMPKKGRGELTKSKALSLTTAIGLALRGAAANPFGNQLP